MRVVVLVPRRADGGWRDELWDWCRRWWEHHHPDWDIVEGHHTDGPFNRAAAINDAATRAGGFDVAVIIDSDIVVDLVDVRRAVDQVAARGGMVLPFRRRVTLTRQATTNLLATDPARPRVPMTRHPTTDHQTYNVSTCVVIDRATFTKVRGFDERFEGWGGEDDAFHAAVKTVSTVERTRGTAWHLHHDRSSWRADGPLYRQALALADRYCAAAGIDRRRPEVARPHVEAMRRLLAEDRGDDQVVVVCLTNGRRRPLLDRTLSSFAEMVTGPIGRRLIVGDGCAPTVRGWETTTVRGGNYRRAMAEAQRRAIGSGQPWVFWLEDDWRFDRPVDLVEFQATMNRHPHVVQMSLQRQAWYRPEKAVGGIYATDPAAFVQADGFVEHRRYWTQNPMLTRRSILAEHPWPQVQQSEWEFARLVLGVDEARRCGVWGNLDDDPWVTHLGKQRAGNPRGY